MNESSQAVKKVSGAVRAMSLWVSTSVYSRSPVIC